MPAQPPFLTPTRTPAIGRSAFSMISWTRFAAASESVRTLKLGRGIILSGGRVQGPGRSISLTDKDSSAVRRGRSPHVERDPRLVGHAALVPGRVEDHV